MQAGFHASSAANELGLQVVIKENHQLLAHTPPTPFQVLPVGSALFKFFRLYALPCLGLLSKVCSPGGGGLRS